jgi:hypothetical protein
VSALDFAGNEGPSVLLGSTTDVHDHALPTCLAVHQNAPNPFNPLTNIAYDVPAGVEELVIRVHDVAGRHVRTLVSGPVPPGRHTVAWSGTNESGEAVASGVYYYTLEAPGHLATRKMVLMK